MNRRKWESKRSGKIVKKKKKQTEVEETDEKESEEGKKKIAVRIKNAVKWMAPSQRARAKIVWTGEYSVPRKTVGSVTPSCRIPLVSSPSRSIRAREFHASTSSPFLSQIIKYVKESRRSGFFERVSKRAGHTWRYNTG